MVGQISSDVDKDDLLDIVENKRKISEKRLLRLKVDISTVFRHLKRLGFIPKLDTWVPHSLSEQ